MSTVSNPLHRLRKPRSLSGLALRGLLAGALAGTAGVFAFGSLAGAQAFAGFDTNQPVDVDADRIDVLDRQNRAVASGDVVITQGDLRLTAARTTLAYSSAGTLTVHRLDATGGVTVTRGNERATAAAGVYDVDRKLIILSGGVELQRDGDTLTGGRMTIDLNSGRSSVDGAGSPTRDDGRVSARFSVPEQ